MDMYTYYMDSSKKDFSSKCRGKIPPPGMNGKESKTGSMQCCMLNTLLIHKKENEIKKKVFSLYFFCTLRSFLLEENLYICLSHSLLLTK